MLTAAGVKTPLDIDLWYMPVQRPYNPNAKRIGEMMQADLAKIGVNAKLVTYEWGEYRKRAQSGEHMTGQLGWTGDNGDPDNFFFLRGCTGRQARPATTFRNGATPSSTTCWTRRATLTDQAERTKLYQRMQEIEHDEAPELQHRAFDRVRGDAHEVTGYKQSPLGTHAFEGVGHPSRAGSGSVPQWAEPAVLGPAMLAYFLRRVALTIPTFLALMFLTFVAIRLVPGDPVEVRVGEHGISPERLAYLPPRARPRPAGLEAVPRLCVAAAARRFRHVARDPAEGADRVPDAVSGDARTVVLRHDVRGPPRRAGRRDRRGQARQRVRPGADDASRCSAIRCRSSGGACCSSCSSRSSSA